MTTLEQIGYTAAGGLGVSLITLGLFGCAVRTRSTYIAPRCTARPPDTIYNPNPTDPSQARGGPMLGWISWCNSLSYDTLLRGVPGTGTRSKGLEGIMLKVNMDGIVLLRFQALCLKIVMMICIICMAVILPINLTARCQFGPHGCFSSNHTNYERTTLAHVPDLANTTNYFDNFYTNDKAGTLGRLYAIVISTWIFTWFAFRCISLEWTTLLALRRVYYLERDHWSERRRDLENSLLRSHGCTDDDDADSRMNKRPPWIPHPEQRETAVNVGLYSVLVGGLPAIPQEEIDHEDIEVAVEMADKKKLDWQLEFATKYFDACVPNSPGYSSSVAAITILPSASDLANAWGKWYSAAGKLRRLRFIQATIKEKLHYEIDEDDADSDDDDPGDDALEKGELTESSQHLLQESQGDVSDFSALYESGTTEINSLKKRKKIGKEIFSDSSENREYYRTVLGVEDSGGLLSYDFGPEQTAMYSREFAQGASNCCPYGCCEERVRRANIDELREMEKEQLEKVHAANLLLDEAQYRAIEEKQLIGEAKAKRQNDLLAKKGLSPDRKSRELLTESVEEDNGVGSLGDLRGLFGSIPGKRLNSMKSLKQIASADDVDILDDTNHWEIFEQILRDAKPHGSHTSTKSTEQKSGCKTFCTTVRDQTHTAIEEIHDIGVGVGGVKDTVADHLTRESTYAVVTFLSRQAAVAARQCLSDGRGENRWVTSNQIPIPPLADAAPFNICFCRGCCRPVSLSIHQRQKTARKQFALALLFTIYVFYTIPLQYATSFLDPSSLDQIFPGYSEWLDDTPWFNELLSGLASGLIFTIFFSLCPVLFKAIANIGSNATSQYAAEYMAMQYFWWFYVVTAIWGNSLSTIVINGLRNSLQDEAVQVLRSIAGTIPTQISATWLNWILVRTFIVMPLHFLLQMNAYLFRCLGWKCCSRMVRGGGAGGPTPYRLYIDGGLVFLCAAALAPASPILAPCALAYFFCCGPLIKRNLIFMYRPNHDAGGARWPFLFEILISSLFVGQIMLTAMMVLKRAYGPAVFAIAPFFFTFMFRLEMRNTFLRAYEDASLFHTSELDGLMADNTSRDLREAFRRFLVDAHKAAFVPVCLARGTRQSDDRGASYILTSEPAIAMDHPNDVLIPGDTPRNGDNSYPLSSANMGQQSMQGVSSSRISLDPLEMTRQYTQYGVSMRRVISVPKDDDSRLGVKEDGSVGSGFHSAPIFSVDSEISAMSMHSSNHKDD